MSDERWDLRDLRSQKPDRDVPREHAVKCPCPLCFEAARLRAVTQARANELAELADAKIRFVQTAEQCRAATAKAELGWREARSWIVAGIALVVGGVFAVGWATAIATVPR